MEINDDNVLTLRAHREDTRDYDTSTMYVSERSFGNFQRSFQLPPVVNRKGDIKCSFENHQLEISVPKWDDKGKKAARIKIDIK